MQGWDENNKMLQNTGARLIHHSPSYAIGGLEKRPDIIIRPLSIAPDRWQLVVISLPEVVEYSQFPNLQQSGA